MRTRYDYLVRRVPNEFAQLDKRGIVKHSTRIKIANDRSGRRAARVADRLNEQLEIFWKGLVDGKPQEQLTSYDTARRRARALGFDYVESGASRYKKAASFHVVEAVRRV